MTHAEESDTRNFYQQVAQVTFLSVSRFLVQVFLLYDLAALLMQETCANFWYQILERV